MSLQKAISIHCKLVKIHEHQPITDSSNRIVLFDSAMAPATFWVKLDDLDLKPGAPVKKLMLSGGKTYNGDASDKFVDAKLFNFASLDTKFEEPQK